MGHRLRTHDMAHCYPRQVKRSQSWTAEALKVAVDPLEMVVEDKDSVAIEPFVAVATYSTVNSFILNQSRHPTGFTLTALGAQHPRTLS